jgi:hypothetical protein
MGCCQSLEAGEPSAPVRPRRSAAVPGVDVAYARAAQAGKASGASPSGALHSPEPPAGRCPEPQHALTPRRCPGPAAAGWRAQPARHRA